MNEFGKNYDGVIVLGEPDALRGAELTIWTNRDNFETLRRVNGLVDFERPCDTHILAHVDVRYDRATVVESIMKIIPGSWLVTPGRYIMGRDGEVLYSE